jgi:WD40 repeat protein
MQILDAGAPVHWLRFLPDGRRLLIGTDAGGQGPVRLVVWPLDGGPKVAIPCPRRNLTAWFDAGYPSTLGFHPTRPLGFVAWGGLMIPFDVRNGRVSPSPRQVEADQFALSIDGRRLVTYRFGVAAESHLRGWDASRDDVRLLWEEPIAGNPIRLCGFLHDGDRIVIAHPNRVSVLSFGDRGARASVRLAATERDRPSIAMDDRTLGLVLRGRLTLLDLPNLDAARTLGEDRGGDPIHAIAFHPDGRTVAVVRGAGEALALHDRDDLGVIRMHDWGVGRLDAVAFSPDGMLGAVGGARGEVVLWDSAG